MTIGSLAEKLWRSKYLQFPIECPMLLNANRWIVTHGAALTQYNGNLSPTAQGPSVIYKK